MPIKKFFAIFLFLTLPLTAASPTLRSETPEAGTDTSLALSNLAVPEDIGKVQERYTGSPATQAGSNLRTIIQIQDVHAHATAQQNIAAILERLRVVFGIEKAALEGAWSSTSLPKSHAIPTSREKQLLAGTLLENDLISGPVYAAIMSPAPIMLIGIEDEASYEKNRALFLVHLEKVEEIGEKLKAYEASLQASQRATWGPELLTFAGAFGKFRETSDLGKFLPLLLETASTLGAVSSDLVQVLLLSDIMALEKSFAKERLEAEVRQIIKKYKNRPWTLEELIRGGKIPPEEIGFYPEIKKLTRLYQMRDKISLRDLTTQIETLTGRILEKLVRTPEESALWEKTERLYLAKKILLLQATPEDMKAYGDEKPLLEAELAKAGLSEPLALSIDFYEMVKKRDEIFFQKIMTNPALAGDIAVVTGGFHTDGLSQKFRDAGIAYITITPDLGGATMNEKLYEERMKENRETGNGPNADQSQRSGDWGRPDYRQSNKSQSQDGKRVTQPFNVPLSTFPASASADDQTLSELRDAPPRAELRFPVAKKVLDVTHDLRKAVNAFEKGSANPASVPDQITYLRSEGRLVSKRPEKGTLAKPEFRVEDFMKLPRPEQIALAIAWNRGPRVMAVSTVDVWQEMLGDPETGKVAATRLNEIKLARDMIALVEKVDQASKIDAALLGSSCIERFTAEDVRTLWAQENGKFARMRKRFPSVIIQDGLSEIEGVTVLPARPVSWIVYRLFALNPDLRLAAGNTDFLDYLAGLMTEIRSQELPKTSV